jgi:hypothetical protein
MDKLGYRNFSFLQELDSVPKRARHLFVFLGFIVLTWLCAGCASMSRARAHVHVLFVGNSLTYVGNLPAVLDALALANGRVVQSDMIVEGGGTLAQRVADGSVERALQETHYDYVVMQERGGDAICSSFRPEYCLPARAALAALAQLAKAHAATPILLGTYQSNPQVSKLLVQTEAAAAGQLSIAYVSLSERMHAASAAFPKANWLYADGGHPGHDLILLEAVLLYRQLFDQIPAAKAFTVDAPMFTPHAKFSAPSPTSHPLASNECQQTYDYSADRLAVALVFAKD